MESSKPREERKFEGMFRPTRLAARVAFEYYENPELEKNKDALDAVDRIDWGLVTEDEVRNPSGWLFLKDP